ncbi:MAG: hypothetical protein PHE77_00020 [Candidatus Pacebacteria bacterium]|nr:hypothetical protein [Candidatus Paceibacterota bacterium]
MKKLIKKIIFIAKLSNEAANLLCRKILIADFILVSVFLLGLYFYQVQDLVKNSYALNKIEQELSEQQGQSLFFSQQTATTAGLDKTEQAILALNFVKNDSIKYIPLTNDYLVRVDR